MVLLGAENSLFAGIAILASRRTCSSVSPFFEFEREAIRGSPRPVEDADLFFGFHGRKICHIFAARAQCPLSTTSCHSAQPWRSGWLKKSILPKRLCRSLRERSFKVIEPPSSSNNNVRRSGGSSPVPACWRDRLVALSSLPSSELFHQQLAGTPFAY